MKNIRAVPEAWIEQLYQTTAYMLLEIVCCNRRLTVQPHIRCTFGRMDVHTIRHVTAVYRSKHVPTGIVLVQLQDHIG